MPLHVLPDRIGSAAENMAHDLLLLQRYPDPCPRFRHYGWREPAFTFGLSQAIAEVRARLPEGRLDLCRRPSGGGVVDHRFDWTFMFIAPRGHPLCEADARASYQAVHRALADCLTAQGEPVVLQPPPEQAGAVMPPGVCFERAEAYDVIRTSGLKVAGAAQKRNKQGLLLQGSIDRSRIEGTVDWVRFAEDFAKALAEVSGETEVVSRPWPDWDAEEEERLVAHYSSDEWNERR